MKGRESTVYLIAGLLPVIWIALLIAPYASGGLPELIKGFTEALDHPASITFCGDSLRTVLLFICAYAFGIAIYYSFRKNYRKGAEMGSAKWGNAFALNRKYAAPNYTDNKILTQNVKIGLDGRKHRRNLNVMVVGGSGAGKTRFFVKPNLLQASVGSGCSFIVLDPKSETVRSLGSFLESQGYDVKVLDLIDMERSHCYNPFVYLSDDNDVQRLVTNLFKATTPKGSQSQDPFWDTAAQMLLLALIFYLKYEAPEEEQNFAMVMEMLRAGDISEEDTMEYSPLDHLFYSLAEREPHHIAVKYYNNYRSGSAKTLKSIQITLASRLEKFNLESMAKLTMTDELELDTIGEKKTALFAVIPDNDTSFNFLVSILYTQLFQQLFHVADYRYGGRLPVHVHFLMDEFANLSMPNDFDKILSVMRSREVSVSIILQNMAQLKALFEKQWESIVGNCDEFLYLGGNEQSTHKYVSKLLGKETIDTNNYNRTYGRNGSYQTGYNINGRELLDPSEVRLLENQYALLFIRGERCVKDLKFDIMSHPNVKYTEDGGAEPYVYGTTENEIAEISVKEILEQENRSSEELSEPTGYELLSEEDLLNKIDEEENENEQN